ncbi:MAG: helix-turn-helix transcriptional regulator [Bacteroidetes bacterium]|nr:helix-turn-helix transcriptional regulator [Bacteroidota bacterium]MCA6444496.1 helix-turn-helix transcriptional regulator [Bacteroidota bacterium]
MKKFYFYGKIYTKMDATSIELTLTNLINKIKTIRKNKGYSMEYMAQCLNISVSGYNKIESNYTNISYKRIIQIQKILQIELSELLDLKTENIYNQNLNDNAVGHQEIQNMYMENKELTNKLISSYQNEIEYLRKQLSKESL